METGKAQCVTLKPLGMFYLIFIFELIHPPFIQPRHGQNLGTILDSVGRPSSLVVNDPNGTSAKKCVNLPELH